MTVLVGLQLKGPQRRPEPFPFHRRGVGASFFAAPAGRGLEGRVSLLGPRPQQELPDWYRAATVVVLPSRSEGVPNVLLEAAACGRPFVASRVGGIPEIAHLGASRLVPPGDAGALAQGLAAFLAGPRPPAKDGTPPARSHEAAASELADLFERLLQTRGRAVRVPCASAAS